MSDVTPGQAARLTLGALLNEIFGDIEHLIGGNPGYIDRDMLDGYRADTSHLLAALAARQPQPAPGCPDPSQHRDVYGRPLPDTMPQPVPGETELRRRIEDVARGLDHRVSAGSRTRMAVASSSLARILRDILAETAAGPEPQAAPELAGSVVRVISTAPELAAAMAESRRYREALESVRAIILEGDNSTEGSRLRRSRAVIRAALEGK